MGFGREASIVVEDMDTVTEVSGVLEAKAARSWATVVDEDAKVVGKLDSREGDVNGSKFHLTVGVLPVGHVNTHRRAGVLPAST